MSGHKRDADSDLESGHSAAQANAGAPLGRQISIQLSNEQYERLFLQTGGQGGKGDLSQRLGNPTPLGIASFLLCFTPFACNLMGWGNVTSAANSMIIGAFYFIGGVGSLLAGVMEWVLGNTFPATVFSTFGGFWLAFAFLLDPTKSIAETLGAASVDYNAGLAIYLVWWSLLIFSWYLLLVLILGSTGFPLALPVGDLSGFLSRKVRKSA
ncbi:hypothetical protein OIV83_003808 [Microbotryomycetes sp. JL201]|nr:hypothetical protein OIV83_003808 [Microbotryomycetes sp. JL201]